MKLKNDLTDEQVILYYDRFIRKGGYNLLSKLGINKKYFAELCGIIPQNLKPILIGIKRNGEKGREIGIDNKRKVVIGLQRLEANILVIGEFIFNPKK